MPNVWRITAQVKRPAVMSRLFAVGVASCACCFAAGSAACEPGPPDVQSAEAIFVGYVTGERWPDLEAQYAGGAKASAVGTARGYPLLILRVVQTESLAGASPQIVEAVSPCALPINAGERVVVWRNDGKYSAYPAALAGGEKAVRRALREHH
jgi:hypothetical protein